MDYKLNMELKLKEKDTCFEYSEDPEALKELLKTISIHTVFKAYMTYFPEDKEKRITINVIIQKGESKINFDYGMSIHDTEILNAIPFDIRNKPIAGKWYKGMRQLKNDKRRIREDLLYSILTCIKSDYSIPDRFNDFCSDLGYNNDSIKSLETYNKCMVQKEKLEKIFNDTNIECLPS